MFICIIKEVSGSLKNSDHSVIFFSALSIDRSIERDTEKSSTKRTNFKVDFSKFQSATNVFKYFGITDLLDVDMIFKHEHKIMVKLKVVVSKA